MIAMASFMFDGLEEKMSEPGKFKEDEGVGGIEEDKDVEGVRAVAAVKQILALWDDVTWSLVGVRTTAAPTWLTAASTCPGSLQFFHQRSQLKLTLMNWMRMIYLLSLLSGLLQL
mmetsp:Transcript_31605/g.62613  ORF Transcript_31605/g.62613 Transcript_31605/m.62613 type:complete len:115 (+) Transcript_31605:39-383(+)